MDTIGSLRLIDDVFMNACFDKNVEGTELILRIILDRNDIIVKQVNTQKKIPNLRGRSICLDVEAFDESGKKYNIEIQRDNGGAGERRARFHSSIMDVDLLEKNADFKDLPDTFVIFITERDYFKMNKPIYWIERTIRGSGREFRDGSYIIYVNGACRDTDTALGRLMHDFFCTKAEDMYYKELADTVSSFKDEEKGINAMAKTYYDLIEELKTIYVEEGREEGKAEGLAEGKTESIINSIRKIMKNTGATSSDAMRILEIPPEEWARYDRLLSAGN